ncbi:hypothetical protein UlMin_001415 [Ulmus minor]
MRPQIHSFLFLVFVLQFCSLGLSDLIQDSCKKASDNDPNISNDFCVSTLEANPKSQTATTLGELALSAMDITISNGTSISSTISFLLKNSTLDPFVQSCLQDCSKLYSDASDSLFDAEAAITNKDFGTAKSDTSAAMDAPSTCEDGFKEKKGVVSPLTKESNLFFQFTAISLAFLNMVARQSSS